MEYEKFSNVMDGVNSRKCYARRKDWKLGTYIERQPAKFLPDKIFKVLPSGEVEPFKVKTSDKFAEWELIKKN